MEYGLSQTVTLEGDNCLVLGFFNDNPFNEITTVLDQKLEGLVSKLVAKLPEKGNWLWQAEINHCSLMVINFGQQADYNAMNLRQRLSEITGALLKHNMTNATLYLPQLTQHEANWQLTQMLLQMDAQCYQLNTFKSQNIKPFKLNTIKFYLPGASEEAIHIGQAIASGIRLTRTLADFPANHCTPCYLGEQANELARELPNLKTTVFGLEEIKAMGMGALLAVAQGSDEPPRLIEVVYQGGKPQEAPIVLVGKGITFDSGGISLKPANVMDEMKYDMAGAASILGTLKACALLKLPINVIGLLACAENMPSGKAVKPGDIITTMSGQTVEILNTDAEGRLVLADALTYAERYQPELVIDIATLTGAMVVALGFITTGFMTKDEQLAQQIMEAAHVSEDKCWRLPLEEAYQDALESPIADMINASFDRSAGSITAACFLERFTKKYRWAHLDIAGTAWISGKKRQATGRPVPLLIQLLRHAATSR